MLRMLLDRLLLVLLASILTLAAVEHLKRTEPPLLVQADYERCSKVVTPPLSKPRGPVFYPRNSELT